jgi:polar amino acid transport system substrate-binding protein
MRPVLVTTLVLTLFMAAAPARAQTADAPAPAPTAEPTPTPPAAKKTLKVYTKPIEPFSFQKDERAMGFSVELWDRIARELGVQYEWVWVASVGEVIDAVKNGQGDVGIAAISITSEREAAVDFSTPFYQSGLGILVHAQGRSIFSLMKETFWTASTAKWGLILLLLLVACAHLVWWFERKSNAEQFPQPYAKGLWESSWWAISTILSGGCDAKGPNHVLGRLFGALWMLTCIIVITYFTAAITTVMTVNQLTSDIDGPNDLPGKKVATVKGSTAERYLNAHGVKVSAFDKIDGAYEALEKKDVVAVVYDQPILAYHLKIAGSSGEDVVGLFERQNYGIALPSGSPMRKDVNRILLKLGEDGFLDELRTKWFGDE